MKLENLQEKGIFDVVSVGYMSIENNVMEYKPLLHTIYFQYEEDEYYQFHVNEYDLRLELKIVNKIEYSYDICEEVMYGCGSIGEVVMPDTCMSEANISKIEFYNMESLEDMITCSACELTLKRGEKIFIDPTWLCGINIGGEDVKKKFFDNFEESVEITVVE